MAKQRELYRVDQLPIFQNRMYDSEAQAKACPKGDIRLVEDRETGLIYNAAFRPELMTYDEHYQNEQGLSPLFQGHLMAVADLVERTLGRQSLVEVGCGKGLFLEMLATRGVSITGVDPTYEGSNPAIVKEFFTPQLGLQADGIVLRHVLEHVQGPFEFLQHIKEANGGRGKIYIEVPCFDWICERRAWFDVFYEHVNYFRLADLRRMFGVVHDSGRLFGDQYLYVVADLASLTEPRFENPIDFPEDFLSSLEAPPAAGGDGRAAIWGGASKGVIFALLKSRMGMAVDCVIDINPAKQGKYLPATGLRVQSPQEALAHLPKGSAIYVMNSNYLDEIKQMSGNAYTYIEIDNDRF